MGRTTITLHDETKQKLVKIRGQMERSNGKRRSLEDTLIEMMDIYEGKKHCSG